jgi:hypothetical protein
MDLGPDHRGAVPGQPGRHEGLKGVVGAAGIVEQGGDGSGHNQSSSGGARPASRTARAVLWLVNGRAGDWFRAEAPAA